MLGCLRSPWLSLAALPSPRARQPANALGDAGSIAGEKVQLGTAFPGSRGAFLPATKRQGVSRTHGHRQQGVEAWAGAGGGGCGLREDSGWGGGGEGRRPM